MEWRTAIAKHHVSDSTPASKIVLKERHAVTRVLPWLFSLLIVVCAL